jgi:hypothetical protein
VHTIIYTHHHIDHMLGAWALLAAGERPQIIATTELLEEVGRDVRSRELTARLNNQTLAEFPRAASDLPLPTGTFDGRLELEIGHDRFVLTHAPGETADQLWVLGADPTHRGRRRLLPTVPAERRQRQASSTLRRYVGRRRCADMVALEPTPAPSRCTGRRSTDAKENRPSLSATSARMLEAVENQAIAALNAGTRRIRSRPRHHPARRARREPGCGRALRHAA